MTSCSVPDIPDKDVSGDNLYGPRICDQPFIDWAWPAYKFNSDYWRHGFGFEDVCNTDLPTARALSAIWLLNYSADDYMNEEWSSSCLHWACRYVREQVGDLRAKCSNGTYIAYAFGGHIELYLGCFYSKSVPGRAETLVHECRQMPISPAGRGLDQENLAPIPHGVTRARGCMARCICGGSTPKARVQRRP